MQRKKDLGPSLSSRSTTRLRWQLRSKLIGAALVACAALACGGIARTAGEGETGEAAQSLLKIPIGQFKSITAGRAHACGLSGAGVAYCWGDKSELATGEPATALPSLPAPVPVETSERFVSIVAGDRHACGLRVSQDAFCWGSNDVGQLGNGSAIVARVMPLPVAGTFSQLVGGTDFTCGLDATTGVAFCWGGNDQGQLGSNSTASFSTTPQRVVDANGVAPTFIQIAAGGKRACALDGQQKVWCWGLLSSSGIQPFNRFAAPTVLPSNLQSFTWASISTGVDSTCGIVGAGSAPGQAYCWGTGANGGPIFPPDGAVPGGLTYRSLSVGPAYYNHSCGLTTAGDITCWGANAKGQLGNGSTGLPVLSPVLVAGGITWKSVSVNALTTCATDAGDSLFCWGDGSNDLLGDNRAAPGVSSVPVKVASTRRYASAAIGGDHFGCAIVRDGATVCWGMQKFHVGSGMPQFVDDLGVEPLETCPAYGTSCRTTPWPIARGQTFSSISAGWKHTCALDTGGQVFCFGGNYYGQLGNGTTTGSPSCPNGVGNCTSDPQPIQSYATFSQVTTGAYHTCALGVSTGTATCWGKNSDGQVGVGSLVDSLPRPLPVATSEHFVQISAGYAHTCAVTATGNLFCWGSNKAGQIGNGTSGGQVTNPQQVTLPGPAVSVSAGYTDTCAIVRAGTASAPLRTLYCWGGNYWGEVGDGTRSMVTSPKLVNATTDYYLDYVAGHGFACGIQVPPPPWPSSFPAGLSDPPTSGPLYCWGFLPGSSDTLYGPSAVWATQPTVMAPGVSFRSIRGAAGYAFLCGITSDGKTQCFGRNDYGQLGSWDAPLSSASPLVVTGD